MNVEAPQPDLASSPAPGARSSAPRMKAEVAAICRWAVGYLRPYRPSVVVLLLLSAVEVGVGLLRPWPLKFLVDHVLSGGAKQPIAGLSLGAQGLLALTCGVYLLIHFTSEVVSAGHTQVQVGLGQRLLTDLRQQLFSHLQSLSLRFHLRRGTGDTIYHVENDAYCVEKLTLAGLLPLLSSAATLLAMFAVLFQMNWRLAVTSLLVLPALLLVNRHFMERMVSGSERLKEIESRSLSFVQEVFSSIRVVKAFGREDHEAGRFAAQGKRIIDARLQLTLQESLYGASINLITNAATAGVLYLGGVQVLGGHMSIGDLLVAMSYLASVFDPLSRMSRTLGSVQESIASARRVLRTLENEPEIRDRRNAVAAPRLRGQVEFAGVSFEYEPGRPVLEEISFEARPGQTVAIVGLTGAGKTTLVSLVARFYEPGQGKVCIDGRDIRDYTVRSLRSQVAMVLQDPLLLSGTVADNIRYGRLDATDEEVMEAARAAYAHDFILRLPQGYDTRLGDEGTQLSGGERQRISIARALLRDAPILILDEPTSSLDARAEAHVMDALARLMRDRTTFVIAHRLSTVRHADKIVVLQEGKVAGLGTHEENIAQVPLYRELCQRLAV